MLRGIMIDSARALTLAGMKRVPAKMVITLRQHLPGHGFAYEHRALDLKAVDQPVNSLAEHAAIQLLNGMLQRPEILMGAFIQSVGDAGQGETIVMRLATRRTIQRETFDPLGAGRTP